LFGRAPFAGLEEIVAVGKHFRKKFNHQGMIVIEGFAVAGRSEGAHREPRTGAIALRDGGKASRFFDEGPIAVLFAILSPDIEHAILLVLLEDFRERFFGDVRALARIDFRPHDVDIQFNDAVDVG